MTRRWTANYGTRRFHSTFTTWSGGYRRGQVKSLCQEPIEQYFEELQRSPAPNVYPVKFDS